MAAARYAVRAAGAAYSAYNVFDGTRRMASGFSSGDSQQVAGGAMQAYSGATGPLFSAVSKGVSAAHTVSAGRVASAASGVHAGSVFGARMAIPQERQEMRNRVSASVQAAADVLS